MNEKEKLAEQLKKELRLHPEIKDNRNIEEFYSENPHQLALRDQISKTLSDKHGLTEQQVSQALRSAEALLNEFILDEKVDAMLLGKEPKSADELVEAASIKLALELMDMVRRING